MPRAAAAQGRAPSEQELREELHAAEHGQLLGGSAAPGRLSLGVRPRARRWLLQSFLLPGHVGLALLLALDPTLPALPHAPGWRKRWQCRQQQPLRPTERVQHADPSARRARLRARQALAHRAQGEAQGDDDRPV